MILTITPNPAVDITWHVSHLLPGTTHRMPTGVNRAGGKGLNVARVLSQTGHEVVVLATAGGQTGDAIRADLLRARLPHRLISTRGDTRRSIAIVDSENETTTVLNELGATLDRAELTAFLSAAQELGTSAQAVAISGSLPPGFQSDHVAELVGRFVANGIPVVVDTSGPALLAAAKAGAHVLKPNRDEIADATGIADPLAGARHLLALGARLVVTSLGTEGLLVVAPHGAPVRAKLPRVLRGNPTGAGDAVVAAIAAALATGTHLWADSPPAHEVRIELARQATAWSAAAVLMPLAGEISDEHIALADDVRIETITEESQ